MSVISNLIFKNQTHYITSKFGPRGVIPTAKGNTGSYHNGTDYGTNGKKIAQYAIEDGYVFDANKASDGALYVWVIYPRIKKAFLHYHLNSYKVKAGQEVSKGTLLGTTGKTGKATGIHLHLGIRDLSSLNTDRINNMTWAALRSCGYIDPEKVKYTAPATKFTMHKRGYYKKGDTSESIEMMSKFMRETFPAYTSSKAVSNNFNSYLRSAIKEFQKRTGLKADGFAGPLTVEKMVKYGFKK